MKLPLTLEMMAECRLKVTDCLLQPDNKVMVVWSEMPTEYERMVAQNCTMNQPCIHHWS